MKNVIALVLISTFAMSSIIKDTTVKSEALKLCKSHIQKAHNYQDTMTYDAKGKATLKSYKEKVVKFCSVVR